MEQVMLRVWFDGMSNIVDVEGTKEFVDLLMKLLKKEFGEDKVKRR